MKRVFEAHPLKSVRVKGSALHEMLSGLLFFQLLQAEFMKVKSTSDEHNLQFCLFKPSSSESVIGTVPLHFTKCTPEYCDSYEATHREYNSDYPGPPDGSWLIPYSN